MKNVEICHPSSTRESHSLLQEDDVDVVVRALQEHLPIEVDDFPLLRSSKGSDQRLEDVRAAVVREQHPELHLRRVGTDERRNSAPRVEITRDVVQRLEWPTGTTAPRECRDAGGRRAHRGLSVHVPAEPLDLLDELFHLSLDVEPHLRRARAGRSDDSKRWMVGETRWLRNLCCSRQEWRVEKNR